MPSDSGLSVQATGIKELRDLLKAAADRTPRELTAAHKRLATTVASRAEAKAGGAYVSGRAAATIRGSGSALGGRILVGSDAVPWALGNEFGGGAFGPGDPTPAGGHTTQFKPWLGRAGYAVYPTIRAMQPEIEALYFAELRSITAAGFS